MNKKVLVGSPICQDKEILTEFLISLKELNLKNIEMGYCFVDDNKESESTKLLIEFKKEMINVVLLEVQKTNITSDYCNEYTHNWNTDLINKVAYFKNEIINYFLKSTYEYLFFIDSDIVLNKEALQSLIEQDKDIISNIFWTKWNPQSPEMPQVWVKDFYTFHDERAGITLEDEEIKRQTEEFLNKLKIPGVYRVGGLGACTLIKREPLEKGINFNEIYNISFWGEDRAFCIRAAAYGYELFVDTHYPAYHIYRKSDLKGVDAFKKGIYEKGKKNNKRLIRSIKNESKLTLSMIVKNEEERYLERVLIQNKKYIDNAIIIDDCSTDRTAEIVKDILGDRNLVLIENRESMFRNEVELRRLQWNETISTDPEWILNLDADEIFEKSFEEEVRNLIESNSECDLYAFRLYDFWDEEHYREDKYWNAHSIYRPFLTRYQKNYKYSWLENPLHCGRFPNNIFGLNTELSTYRLKHYGWAKKEDRERKFREYIERDPLGRFGDMNQYLSILENNPNIIKWDE